ncbi:MAG: DMT family transporter, partial [Candidatus Thermoplasmatota archaeon]|nr:DMT family transporter [Candidatus Thermoplasmatota archaeon]
MPRLGPGLAATLLAAILWGTSFPANQVGLAYLEPGLFVAARFALAALIVLPLFWRELKSSLTGFAPWLLGAVNALAFYLQYVGQTTAPAGAAGLLVNANVVLVALVAWAWIGEKPTNRVTLAMVLALAGASLIIYEPGQAGLQMGHALVFLAGATWSFYMVGSRAARLKGHTATGLALATFVT